MQIQEGFYPIKNYKKKQNLLVDFQILFELQTLSINQLIKNL